MLFACGFDLHISRSTATEFEIHHSIFAFALISRSLNFKTSFHSMQLIIIVCSIYR